MVTYSSSPAFLVQHGEKRNCWCLAVADGFADLDENMIGIMMGDRRGLTVATQVVIWAVSTLQERGEVNSQDWNHCHRQLVIPFAFLSMRYLVTNTKYSGVTTIAYNTGVWSLVKRKCQLARVGNGDKSMAFVVDFSKREAFLAQVVVRALEALVSRASNHHGANIAGCQMCYGFWSSGRAL